MQSRIMNFVWTVGLVASWVGVATGVCPMYVALIVSTPGVLILFGVCETKEAE